MLFTFVNIPSKVTKIDSHAFEECEFYKKCLKFCSESNLIIVTFVYMIFFLAK